MMRSTKTPHLGRRGSVVDELHERLLKASTTLPDLPDLENNSVEIRELISQIQESQENDDGDKFKFKPLDGDRATLIERFTKWCAKNGVDTEKAEISLFPGYGLGLRAKQKIELHEVFLTIPDNLIFSTREPQRVVAPLIKSDPIASGMQNVALALNLIAERVNGRSRWKSYIDMLPREYRTPLYFTHDEMLSLKGSPAFDQSIALQRNIARQYAYFYKIIQTEEQYKSLRQQFTYNMYRWAVCSLMTRQNRIPGLGLCLIPFWDMCNHKAGEVLTDYDRAAGKLYCYTQEQTAEGEQIFMCYNQGSNCVFLCHNGFINKDNPNNKIKLHLRLLKKDPLKSEKVELISQWVPNPCSCTDDEKSISYTVAVPSLFSRRFSQSMPASLDPSDESPATGAPASQLEDSIDTQVMPFLRVACASKDEIEGLSKLSDQSNEISPVSQPISDENELKCWKMLDLNCMLLLRGYKQESTAEEGLTETVEMTRQLIEEEKAMINDIKLICARRLQRKSR